MKKIIVFIFLMIFAVSLQPVYADETVSEIEYLDDGCYYETVIESEDPGDGVRLPGQGAHGPAHLLPP